MSADKDSANHEDEGDNAELDLSRLVKVNSGDPEADTAADEQPAERRPMNCLLMRRLTTIRPTNCLLKLRLKTIRLTTIRLKTISSRKRIRKAVRKPLTTRTH